MGPNPTLVQYQQHIVVCTYLFRFIFSRSRSDKLIDNTLDSCLRRIVRDMGDEATRLLKGRVQIIK